MKGKTSVLGSTNVIIPCVILAIIILGIIFVVMNKKSHDNEQFANEEKKQYNFRSIRAANGMITGVIRLAGEPKNPDEKEIRDRLCPVKNGDKGSYICEERSYNKTESPKVACGCMYDVSDTDPDNLFNKKKN